MIHNSISSNQIVHKRIDHNLTYTKLNDMRLNSALINRAQYN